MVGITIQPEEVKSKESFTCDPKDRGVLRPDFSTSLPPAAVFLNALSNALEEVTDWAAASSMLFRSPSELSQGLF